MRTWDAWLRGCWQPCFLIYIRFAGHIGCASVYGCTSVMVFMEVSGVVRHFNAYSIEITTGPLGELFEKRESYLHKRACIWYQRRYNWYWSVILNTWYQHFGVRMASTYQKEMMQSDRQVCCIHWHMCLKLVSHLYMHVFPICIYTCCWAIGVSWWLSPLSHVLIIEMMKCMMVEGGEASDREKGERKLCQCPVDTMRREILSTSPFPLLSKGERDSIVCHILHVWETMDHTKGEKENL